MENELFDLVQRAQNGDNEAMHEIISFLCRLLKVQDTK